MLTSAVSPQRLFVRCEDVKESKTEDYILKNARCFFFSLWENAKSLKKCASCRSMSWNIDVQETWPKPHKMEEKQLPNEIKDINQKDTNSDAEKLLQIPAHELEAHKAGFRKKVKMHAQ